MSASLPALLPQPPKIRVHATCPVRFEGEQAVLRCLTPSRSIVDVEIDGAVWAATFGVELPVPVAKPRRPHFTGPLKLLIDEDLPAPMRRALKLALEEFPNGFGFGYVGHDGLFAHAEKHGVSPRAFRRAWTCTRTRLLNRRHSAGRPTGSETLRVGDQNAARASSLASSDTQGVCRETAPSFAPPGGASEGRPAGGALGCAPSAFGKSNHR